MCSVCVRVCVCVCVCVCVRARAQNIDCINPLHAKLNPICHLLAVLGAHHILHVSRVRVNVEQLISGYVVNNTTVYV